MLHDDTLTQTLSELERQRQDQLASSPARGIPHARD